MFEAAQVITNSMIKFDRYALQFSSSSHLRVFSSTLVVLLFFTACSLIPPVQEMSNARQSLQSAKDVGAEDIDSKRFSKAKQLLDLASEKMDSGEYTEARNLALEARSIAIKARQVSVTKK